MGVQPPTLMVVAPGKINIADYSSKVSEEIKLLTKRNRAKVFLRSNMNGLEDS